MFLGDPKKQDLQNPQNLNSYSYATNNPIVKSDPNGKCVGPLLIVCIYAAETAPVWVPAAITWGAAAGLAITTPLVVGAAVSYSRGDQATGDAFTSTAMTVFGGIAGGTGALMEVGDQLGGLFSGRCRCNSCEDSWQ